MLSINIFYREVWQTGIYMRLNNVFGTCGIGKQQHNFIASHCSCKLDFSEKQHEVSSYREEMSISPIVLE